MSVYHTLTISREAALRAYINYKIGNIPDNELENVIDSLLEKSLYNCTITPNDGEEDDDTLNHILGI